MRAREFITENKTTLNKLYNGNFPDRDESFWDEVRPHEFDNELEVKVLPKHKLAIMIQSQYRVEHLDEILDMMDEDQQEILQRYMSDPNLSNKIILLSGDRIIDGNHRALAAAMKGVPIKYVDLADLDEQGVTESDGHPKSFTNNGLTWTLEHLGSIDGKDLGAGGLIDIFKGYQDINNKGKFRWFIRGQRTGVLRPVSSEHTAIRKFLHPNVANNDEYKKFTEQGVTEDTSKLNYIGNCTDDDVIEHLFGDATGFAQAVEEYGDDFELDDLVVKYDPDSDIHSFYYKQQDVTEGFDKEAGAWRDWQLKMLPRKIEMLSRLVKGWVPSEEDHIAAIEAGYDAMKETGDVKDAAKAIADTLKEIQRRQGVAESIVRIKVSELSVNRNTTVHKWQLRSDKNFGLINEVPGVILKNVSVSIDQNAYDNDRKIFAYLQGEKTDSVPRGLKPFPIVYQRNGTYPFIDKSTGDPIENVAYVEFTDQGKVIGYQQGVTEGKQQVERNGIQLNVSIDGATVDIRPMINGNQVGYVVFDRDGKTLVADDLAIDEEYRGRGIAKIIYDYLKELGFTVKRSTDQLPAGKAFWDKYKGVQGQVWEDEHVDEMALSTYKTMGDFSKPGPFTGADKKLVPHPKNIEKATRFFEQTPFDFRLFFSHLKGTGKYSEHGPMSHDQIRQVFGQDSEEIINGSEDAITVVYVGNKGDSKVMLTPWMMAHRFGHAINAGARNKNWTAWGEAENYFFQTVNNLLDEHYGKAYRGANTYRTEIKWDMTPEYNALFNAIGTQRSSKTGQIRRPYEFLYELFAQYLGTGKVTLNPLPTNLTYGRKVFGNPTKFMNIKPEYRDEGERKQAADSLAYTMELLFNDVLGDSVGKIFVM